MQQRQKAFSSNGMGTLLKRHRKRRQSDKIASFLHPLNGTVTPQIHQMLSI
jgi:hypothetical protein